MSISSLQSLLESCLQQATVCARRAREIAHKSPRSDAAQSMESILHRVAAILDQAMDILEPAAAVVQRARYRAMLRGGIRMRNRSTGKTRPLCNEDLLELNNRIAATKPGDLWEPIMVTKWDDQGEPLQWTLLPTETPEDRLFRDL